MPCLQLVLLTLAQVVVAVVSGVSFNLTHRRVWNTIYLTCDVLNGTIDPRQVHFWINETKKLDVVGRADRVSWKYNIISFHLKPKYEGTFFCGKRNGEHSNGLGPFAARPAPYKWSTATIRKYGDNTTIRCRHPLGALSQAYHVTWYSDSKTSFPDQYEMGVSSDHRPILTLINIREENIGIYTCKVKVTNPYDGKVWYRTAGTKLKYKCEDCDKSTLLWIPFVVMFILIILALSVCQIVCDPKRKEISAPQDNYNYLDIRKKENIGNGAFGSVFKATYWNSPCAAKLLTHHAQQMATGGSFPTAAGIQEESLKAFRRECDFLEALRHENIVSHLATVTEPNSNLPVLIMELMDGNLKQYLEHQRGNKLSLLWQINLCLDITKGLKYLHSKNVIHRDLCDVNILINIRDDYKCPQAKVADFGMSRILPYDYLSATLTGLGHRQVYLPPEAPDEHYSYTLDIYSFGVIAVQIVHAKAQLKKKSEVQSLLEEIPNSHFLQSIISSCLSEDRKSRPQAAGIVAAITQLS